MKVVEDRNDDFILAQEGFVFFNVKTEKFICKENTNIGWSAEFPTCWDDDAVDGAVAHINDSFSRNRRKHDYDIFDGNTFVVPAKVYRNVDNNEVCFEFDYQWHGIVDVAEWVFNV